MLTSPQASTKRSNISLIALEMMRSTGGSCKTVDLFSRALQGNVYAITRVQDLEKADIGIEHATYLQTSANPFAKHFLIPRRDQHFLEAEHSIAQSQLISCHTLFRYHNQWVYKLSKTHAIPYWIVPHGSLDDYVFTYRSFQKKLWMRLFGIHFLRRASVCIFATQREAKRSSRWVPQNKQRVIYWPIDPPEPTSEEACNELRRQMGIAQDAKILLWLGRLHSIKQPLEAIKAFLEANPQKTHLIVAGPESDVTIEQCRKAACGNSHVHITGAVYDENKNILMQTANAYLSLSLRENFGHVAGEMMIRKKPLILSAGNYLSDDIRHTGCGWFLDSRSGMDAASAIREFDNCPMETLATMGRAGYQWADAHLKFEQFQSTLQDTACSIIQSWHTKMQ